MKFVLVLFWLSIFPAEVDDFLTSTTGTVSFYSEAPLEKIHATNKKFQVKFNPSSGNIEATVLMKGFQFRKALMQEHFNENYVESDKYPKTTFSGNVSPAGMKLSVNKTYEVVARGTLTLHGISKPVEVPGTISFVDNELSLKAVFSILLSDYKIRIPAVVRDNIGKTVEITVRAEGFK